MGKRGKGARSTRARKGQPWGYGSPQYWDLVLGEYEGRPYWSDPLDPERAAAWELWRGNIFDRWPLLRRYGRRPDAWFAFDLPLLDGPAWMGELSDEQLAAITREEWVYHLDADAAERKEIEDGWRRAIEHAQGGFAGDAAALRVHATAAWRVPEWFYDKESK